MGLFGWIKGKSRKHNDALAHEECMQMLQVVLDEEADEKKNKQVHEHLQKCMKCYEMFHLDKKIKELLKARCNNVNVPEGLIESIKSKVNNNPT